MADDNREDVIAVLQGQHEQIRQAFTDLETAPADRRHDLFQNLVRMLAVHETVEEEVVHPVARRLEDAETVVKARLEEERRAKELLSKMDEMGPEADGFDTSLRQLRDAVLAHAQHEEQEEFPLLRKGQSADRLRAMAVTIRAVEKIAPTRPHPGLETAVENALLGPPMAIMDRVRDALHKTTTR
jgi:hemerythrin superfamily protein